jgi:hypothetical protein
MRRSIPRRICLPLTCDQTTHDSDRREGERLGKGDLADPRGTRARPPGVRHPLPAVQGDGPRKGYWYSESTEVRTSQKFMGCGVSRLTANNRCIEALDHHRWLTGGEIPKQQLPKGIVRGFEYQSVCINTAIYLPYLLSQCLKNGVIIKRAIFKHISDAAPPGVHHSGQAADLVMNCTGLSSRKLGGVEDSAMTPARGQIVLVREDAGAMYSTTGTDNDEDEMAYIMTRAAGGGTILGGCYQEGNWESQPDPNLAVRIMERAVKMCPDLTEGKGIEHLSVVRHGVGLRPLRQGGARLEAETIRGVKVVHLYGHSGSGYQSSYGSCEEAVALVEKSLSKNARL